MNNIEYIILIHENVGLISTISCLTLIIYFLVFSKSISGYGDSILVGYIACSFAAISVYFLAYLNKINNTYIISFLITEIAFFAGAFFLKNSKITPISLGKIKKNEFTLLYIIITFLFYCSSIFYFYSAGILITQQISRLDVAESLGAFYWVFDCLLTSYPIIILSKSYAFKLRLHFIDKTGILIVAFLYISIGSKSSILLLALTLFTFYYFYGLSIPKYVKYILLSSPFFIFLSTYLILKNWSSDEGVFQHLIERFFLFGDTFTHGYNESFLLTLPSIDIFDYFIPGTKQKILSILGMPTAEKFVLGYKVSEFYYNMSTGIGVNARQNIISHIIFWPYFSIFFSFALGLSYKFIRKFRTKNGWMLNYLICFYNAVSFQIFIDPSLFFGSLIKITLVMLPIFILIKLITPIKRWTQVRSATPPLSQNSPPESE